MQDHHPGRQIDAALRLLLVAALVAACLWIAAPFLTILLWAALVAVMLWPLHARLRTQAGFNNARSATLIGVVGVSLLTVPLALTVTAIAGSLLDLAAGWRAGALVLPARPDWLAGLPLVGARVAAAWDSARGNFEQMLVVHADTLRTGAVKMAGIAAGSLVGLLAAVASLAVAAIVLAWGQESAGLMRDVFVRVTASRERGERLLALSTATVRGVLQGVVGVALVQAVLLGLGFIVAGVPYAMLLTLAVLVLGIIQLPPLLVTLPVMAWAWNSLDATTAGIFTAWTLIAGLSDNILKPMMLGRGLEVPMPVILIGVIGGMLADGLLGLFLGPVVLAVGYVLFHEWLDAGTPDGVAR